MKPLDILLYETVVCEILAKSGRVYTYEPMEYLRQIQSNQSDSQIDLLVDRCLQEKLKFCRWDREHTGVVDSENYLRSSIKKLFVVIRMALQDQALRDDAKPAKLGVTGRGWTIRIPFKQLKEIVEGAFPNPSDSPDAN